MIGYFVTNDQSEVAFAQFGRCEEISSMRLVPGPCCMVVLADGTEEMFTHEIHADILQGLGDINKILIAHIDDTGNTEREYYVSFTSELS